MLYAIILLVPQITLWFILLLHTINLCVYIYVYMYEGLCSLLLIYIIYIIVDLLYLRYFPYRPQKE